MDGGAEGDDFHAGRGCTVSEPTLASVEVAALEERRAIIIARRIAAGDDRKRAAYDAIARRDADAADRLVRANAAAVRAEGELAEVEAALTTARRRVASS